MSIYDQFRVTTAKLFARFGIPATVTSTTAGYRDRITEEETPATTTTKAILAVLGEVKVEADDGTESVQSTAKMNGSAKAGDTLTIGNSSFKITDVNVKNPDGGTPMLWIATLS